MNKAQAKLRIVRLRREIDHHRYLYHVLDKQEISAAALDSLKKELSDLETQFPDLVTAASPTQRVGGAPLPGFKQRTHQTRMLSLQDAFSPADLEQWIARNQKIVSAAYEYFTEPKIDGVAIALIYQAGNMVQAATRGDGHVGEDVTHNIKTIEAVPLSLRKKVSGRLEIRGEVYILKKDFVSLNQQRQSAGLPLYANPRNFAAGSIRQLDPKLAAARPLRFFAWEITSGLSFANRQTEYESLMELGFPVPPHAKLLDSLPAIVRYLAREEKRRPRYPFQVDGAVIKINDLAVARRLGVVGKAPRASIAYKFAAEEATTIVEDITVQVGRTGALTPVAHLKSVSVAGTTVSRATLHNADEIKRKDIRVGDTVVIRKAGDIIPEVLKSLPALRPTKSRPFKMPSHCPACGAKVIREAGAKSGSQPGVTIRCPNSQCFPRQRERILHAIGRGGFDIEGLGEKIIEQLLQAGLIETTPDLWALKAGDLTPLERFADKSAAKLVREIAAHKKITLARFLLALGIPQVGSVTAQDIALEFGTLEKIQSAAAADLVQIDGVGPKVAQAISDFLKDASTKTLIKKYQAAGVVVTRAQATGLLNGKTFVFTGSMPDLTRDEAKQIVQDLGGKVASTVGSSVDYVVAGTEPGSKIRQAQRLGLAILTPRQFRQMLKQ